METLYEVISQQDKKGKVEVRRLRDGLVSRCKLSWLEPGPRDGVYQATSKTKAIRLDGLEWVKEGQG